ncbi:MAG: hypothetical protein MGG37_21360, partial [Trichodesmium sp. MAG_R01]|nr:hypothetical protein [Trichodesmium sp. MAG_R01]
LAIAGRRLIGYNMAQLYSIVTPNLTGTKLSLDSLYELALTMETSRLINKLKVKVGRLSLRSLH